MFSSWRDAVSAPSLVDVEAPRCGQTDPRAAARTISGIGARLRSGRGSVVLMTKPESLPRRHEFAAGWVCPPLSAGERSGDLLVRERKAVAVARCLAAPTCPARTLARGVKKSAALTLIHRRTMSVMIVSYRDAGLVLGRGCVAGLACR